MLTPDVTTEPLTAAEHLFGVTLLGCTPSGIEAACRLPTLKAGSSHPIGRLGLLADMTAGRTVRAFLPRGVDIRTANLRMDAGDHPVGPGETIRATGELLTLCATHALGQAVLTAADGAVVARCTARFIVIAGTEPTRQQRWPAVQIAANPDPLKSMPSLVERAEPGRVVLTAQPDARFGNNEGMMHGGVQVALADAALRAAARGAAGGGEPTLIDMTVRYMRPISVTGGTVTLHSTVERAGRMVIVTRARGSDEQGRLLMTAEATFGAADSARTAR
jgi:uncharacterized protein (TIGR00369 family)